MKWIVDRIGKEQTWYSGDVIEKILQVCKQHGLIAHIDRNGETFAHTANPATAKIMRIIESENK